MIYSNPLRTAKGFIVGVIFSFLVTLCCALGYGFYVISDRLAVTEAQHYSAVMLAAELSRKLDASNARLEAALVPESTWKEAADNKIVKPTVGFFNRAYNGATSWLFGEN